jgi:hypothetical protein
MTGAGVASFPRLRRTGTSTEPFVDRVTTGLFMSAGLPIRRTTCFPFHSSQISDDVDERGSFLLCRTRQLIMNVAQDSSRYSLPNMKLELPHSADSGCAHGDGQDSQKLHDE